jgi:hypothetical protein
MCWWLEPNSSGIAGRLAAPGGDPKSLQAYVRFRARSGFSTRLEADWLAGAGGFEVRRETGKE